MRLAISKRGCYHADVYCNDSEVAKKMLRENCISIVAVDYFLNGHDNGKNVIAWAIKKKVLPQFVVITETDRTKRMLLMSELMDGGYRSPDGTTFIKH